MSGPASLKITGTGCRANGFKEAVEIVDHSLLLIVGSVEPGLEDFAVIGQYFPPLVLVDPVVAGEFRRADDCGPRRNVDTELQSIFAAGFSDSSSGRRPCHLAMLSPN